MSLPDFGASEFFHLNDNDSFICCLYTTTPHLQRWLSLASQGLPLPCTSQNTARRLVEAVGHGQLQKAG